MRFAAPRAAMLAGATIISAIPVPASAQAVRFDIPPQAAESGVVALGRQANIEIVAARRFTQGRQTAAVRGQMTVEQALDTLLRGTGLVARRTGARAFVIISDAAPAPSEASAGDLPPTASPNDIIVTAQKRRESIQDVPIAISAFTQETLDKQKIEGGPDLLKAVPNLTFSKSNFAGYNLEIRGIGTKSVSVTSDPGVAVNFNSSTLITNRFFEQEFFDLERVEVLRGPQGTLYGRNATGGVVNIISAKPDLAKFDGYIKGEVGNFQSRRAQGAINIPIITDVLGLRLAGAYTDRDGFTTNDLTGNRIDGRSLYTTRLTAGLKPSSRLRADLVWERFSENDNRSRTAKQLCHRDPGVDRVGPYDLSPAEAGVLSQGCKPGSLYGDSAYGVPNGLSLPYVILGQDIFFGTLGRTGSDGTGQLKPILTFGVDPYADTVQTHDLRRISSISDPKYRAGANVVELNASWNVTDTLSLTSQTAYNHDKYYSTQDYNRFNTVPVFNDSSGLTSPYGDGFNPYPGINIVPGGFYRDPQLGTSNRLVAQDLITSKSEQVSQELRLSTTGSGPLQLTAGGNYTRYRNRTDYYVFINVLSAIAQGAGQFVGNNSGQIDQCAKYDQSTPRPIGTPGTAGCIYIDPNPLSSINGEGHNYFRSSNRYTLDSYGLFGDGTYALTSNVKLIGGVRYNDDVKRTTPVPSQLLLSSDIVLSGTVDRGYPTDAVIHQHFKAMTGRAGLQWSPHTGFTNETMIYATYSRGYKGGGTNPPGVGFSKVNTLDPTQPPFAQLLSYPTRFSPEYVNSMEIGTKNTLFQNRLTLNVTAYYYDFSNYQVSQIIDRSAVNENFNSSMYGAEFEAQFRPIRPLAINTNVGLQHTRIRGGQQSIDVLDRLQGHDDYLLVKAFPILPSNCVVRRDYVEQAIKQARDGGFDSATTFLVNLCPGFALSNPLPAEALPNQGRGFAASVGGNELPNAPHLTMNIGAEYNIPFAGEWVLTPRIDFYHQSASFARVYNTVADRLRGWENVNVSLRVGNPEKGLLVEAYIKNVFDDSPITDAFINSDDTGLTTNVFTFDPRIIGVNITKKF